MEKAFAMNVTDKGLVTKIYKVLLQNTRVTNPTTTRDKGYEQVLTEEPNDKQAFEKMLSITHNQRNTN